MEFKNTNIPNNLIIEQLQSILRYEGIKNSPIIAKFLEYIVTETLGGHEDEIKEYTIAVKALGRPHDFNPQLDAMVRIHAGRLRRIINHYYQEDGKNDLIIISIPKGTYIPVFELQGVKKDEFHNAQTTLLNPSQPHIQQLNQNYTHPKVKLVIMPFYNLNPEDTSNSFIIEMGELLGSGLSRFENLSVISYYSTYQYDSSIRDLQEIRKMADLDFLLTGSVRLMNNSLRVNVQLIHNSSRQIIWAENYIRHFGLNDEFAILEDICDLVLNTIADESGVLLKKGKIVFQPFY